MLLLACCCQLAQAQSAADKIFAKYGQMSEGILSMEATGQQMAQMTKDAKEKAVLEKAEKIRILHTATQKLATGMENDFKSLEAEGYSKLTSNSGQTVMVKYEADKTGIQEAVFCNIEQRGSSLALLTGKFTTDDIKAYKLGRFM